MKQASLSCASAKKIVGDAYASSVGDIMWIGVHYDGKVGRFSRQAFVRLMRMP